MNVQSFLSDSNNDLKKSFDLFQPIRIHKWNLSYGSLKYLKI